MAIAARDFFNYMDTFFDYRENIYEISEQTTRSNRIDLKLFRNCSSSLLLSVKAARSDNSISMRNCCRFCRNISLYDRYFINMHNHRLCLFPKKETVWPSVPWRTISEILYKGSILQNQLI